MNVSFSLFPFLVMKWNGAPAGSGHRLLVQLLTGALTFAGVSAEWFDFLNGGVIIVVLVITRLFAGRSRG